MIKLLFDNNYNIILIVINLLINKKYYILYIINKNNTIYKITTYSLFNI